MTGFANSPSDRVSRDGGVLSATVSVGDGGNAIQATSVPTPCRECYVAISPATPFAVHFAINTSVNVSLGAFLPISSGSGFEPVRIPIDDVSKIWLQSGGIPVKKIINITFRT